jgi:rubrerythrin
VTDQNLTREHQNLGLLEAVRLAKEAEHTASTMYGHAAQEATNPMVRRLFEQLSQFEDLHYRKMLELEESLRSGGAFVQYDEGVGELPVSAAGEVNRIEGVKRTSAAKALNRAIQVEVEAENRYTALAKQTTDPDGRKLFEQLAREEHNHYLVLQNAYYDLGNLKRLA